MGDVTIGIDVATAGVRSIAVARDGAVLATAAASLPAPERTESGTSEQDARTWWPAAEAALREVTAAVHTQGHEAGAVAVAATSGTVVPVDAAGEPAGPALMYDDRRGADRNQRAAEAGAARWRALGLTVTPTAALGRIAWLHEHLRPAGVWHTPEYLGARLLGHPVAADSSHALKSGYDALRREWPAEVFGDLGVPLSLLPDVVTPTTVLGELTEAKAGLPKGCRVVAGMTDGCAGQLASGAVAPGQFVGILGTTYVLKGVTEELVPDPTGALYSHRHPDGWWLPGGASNTGGEAITGTGDLAALDSAAERLGPARAVTYPLRRSGERFPFLASGARGFTVGEVSGEAEAHRARLEGVAFLERLALDHLRRLGVRPAGELFAAGGGNQSPLWTRIRATVTGLPLRLAPHAETGYGAALLAAAALSEGGLTEVSARVAAPAITVEPDETEREPLTASYHRFVTELHQRGWIDDALHRVATG